MIVANEKIAKFEYMIGQTYTDKKGKKFVMSEDYLMAILRQQIAAKRRRKDVPKSFGAINIIEQYITEKDVLNGLNSVTNLVCNNPSFRSETPAQEVRKSRFDLNDLSDYEVGEREYIKKRRQRYIGDREDELEPNDEFAILEVINLELDMIKLRKLKIQDPEDKKELGKKIEPLMKLHQSLCDNLGFLKKQRKKDEVKEESGIFAILEEIEKSKRNFKDELLTEEEEEMEYLKKKRRG